MHGLLRITLALAAVLGILWVSGCMERLFYYPQAGPTPTPPTMLGEEVWFQSADGTRLFGWFFPAQLPSPPPHGGQRAPTILQVHGNAGNIQSHIGFTDYLPAAGFNLFIFDYRGYGQSEGRAVRRGGLIADTHAALDALLAREDVDPKRIGMYGQSLGGAIGLNVMAERPEIKAAVIESAFSSWRGMAACALGGDCPGFFCRTLAAILIADSHRPVDAIKQIAQEADGRALLLLHGDADTVVPVSHSRALAAAVPGRAQLIELPGGEHNSLRLTHPQIERMVAEFFAEHLSE